MKKAQSAVFDGVCSPVAQVALDVVECVPQSLTGIRHISCCGSQEGFSRYGGNPDLALFLKDWSKEQSELEAVADIGILRLQSSWPSTFVLLPNRWHGDALSELNILGQAHARASNTALSSIKRRTVRRIVNAPHTTRARYARW